LNLRHLGPEADNKQYVFVEHRASARSPSACTITSLTIGSCLRIFLA